MSYPPPGLAPSSKSHSSLPARPPPSTAPTPTSFKPAYASNPGFSTHGNNGAAPGSFGGGFQPRQLNTNHQPQPTYQPYPQQPQYGQQPFYGATQDPAYGAPQIRNPFPLPGQDMGTGGRYDASVDPEMEAQIAQWQSAYTGKDSQDPSGFPRRTFNSGQGSFAATSANSAPLGRVDGVQLSSQAVASAVDGNTGVATVVNGADGKQKTVVRSGGGTQWTDSTLLEWDPSHFRIFVGNLAGEVTDESLLKAFSKWPSVQKARVVRDKRTTKSKGFGFVSFSDGDDFFQAARDMQGKYIGSHPVLIKRSTTEIKAVTPRDNKNKKGKGGNKGKGNNQGHDSNAKTGAGIQKAGAKTKGGLRVLG